MLQGEVCEARRDPLHDRWQPVVPDGADPQRRRSRRHQVREDPRRVLRLDSHVPQLGRALDVSNQVERHIVVPDHHQRRTHARHEELRRQRVALRPNVGGPQLPLIWTI